jgi:hypothetical protein
MDGTRRVRGRVWHLHTRLRHLSPPPRPASIPAVGSISPPDPPPAGFAGPDGYPRRCKTHARRQDLALRRLVSSLGDGGGVAQTSLASAGHRRSELPPNRPRAVPTRRGRARGGRERAQSGGLHGCASAWLAGSGGPVAAQQKNGREEEGRERAACRCHSPGHRERGARGEWRAVWSIRL